MTVRDVREVLGARVLAGEEYMDREVRSACGSDMMSDVLAFSKDHSVLLTGLCNPQVIRTAEMLDIVCIVFVRGKKPDESMLEMARERGWWCWPPAIGCFLPAEYSIRPGLTAAPYKCKIGKGTFVMEEAIILKYPISGDDFTRAGEASSDVKRKLKQMGVSPEAIRKAAIAMYEGEINMVIHADGGDITVEITPEKIKMVLDDRGLGLKCGVGHAGRLFYCSG